MIQDIRLIISLNYKLPSQYAKHNIGAKGEDPRPPLIQDPRISVDNWITGGLGPTISKTQSLQTTTQSKQTQNTIRADQSAIQMDHK